MITDSEKRWLRDRKLAPHPYCGWCMKYALCCSPKFAKCPTKNADFGDALEFEGRVAAKLADAYWPPLVYTPVAPFEQLFMPPADRLKWARIKVEEEMDADLRSAE